MSNPLKILRYGDTLFADGLFRMHDEQGFPLAFSLAECRKRGLTPCLNQFRADARKAGWDADKTERVIKEAEADAQ